MHAMYWYTFLGCKYLGVRSFVFQQTVFELLLETCLLLAFYFPSWNIPMIISAIFEPQSYIIDSLCAVLWINKLDASTKGKN